MPVTLAATGLRDEARRPAEAAADIRAHACRHCKPELLDELRGSLHGRRYGIV